MTGWLRSPFRVWLALILLTCLSVLGAEKIEGRAIVLGSIFVIAALKAELIIDHFMEARRAERHWLIMYLIWVVAVTCLLTIGHMPDLWS
jgi:hypothetical protein